MPTRNFMKKSSFTHPPSCILPSFSQNASRLLLPKRSWKCESTISFWKCKRKVVLLVIYLFNYDSSKSTFFTLNYGIWRSLEHSFDQINWNSTFLAIIWRLQEHASFCSVFWCVLFYKKVIVLHHGNYDFFFDIKLTLSTIASTIRNDNVIISLW